MQMIIIAICENVMFFYLSKVQCRKVGLLGLLIHEYCHLC